MIKLFMSVALLCTIVSYVTTTDAYEVGRTIYRRPSFSSYSKASSASSASSVSSASVSALILHRRPSAVGPVAAALSILSSRYRYNCPSITQQKQQPVLFLRQSVNGEDTVIGSNIKTNPSPNTNTNTNTNTNINTNPNPDNYYYDDDDNYDDYDEDNDRYKVILDGLNPSPIEAVTQPIESITRVVAGPGAGKTRVLTCRIAYLLKYQDINANTNANANANSKSRILAVTFTKKASMEMRERLQTLLINDQQYHAPRQKANERREDDAQHANANADADEHGDDHIIEEEYVSPDGNDRQAPPSLINSVTLGTFHSVCSKLLRWHGSQLADLPSVSTLNLSQTYKSDHTVHHTDNDNDNDNDNNNNNNNNDNNNKSSSVLDGSFAIIDQAEQLRIVKLIMKQCDIDLKKGGGTEIRPVTILNAVSTLKSELAMTMGID